MDGHRFDDWARRWAAPSSRRGVLRGLLGGAAGALGLAGGRGAGAAVCRMPGLTCREHANCCSHLCGAKDATGRRRCRCQSPADCPAPDQCHDATCVDGVCGRTVRLGQACDDRNACTLNDTCVADGHCRGVPKTCTALDQCHVAGTCDPSTGTCSNPTAPNGTTCTDGNPLCCGGACCSGVGACTADQCFLSYPDCNPCSATSSESLNLCLPSCSFSCGAACTSSVDCPSGDFCAFVGNCGAGSHCTTGVIV